MKSAHLLSLALVIALPGTLTWAAQHDQHAGHHPAAVAPAPTSKTAPAQSASDMARMDKQTKTMAQMHEKMLAAKTPEERNALMAEHMQTMQEGMSMMTGMSQGGMGKKGDMATRQQMMEKHLEMMAATMQMMMDRLPTAPAK